MKLKNFKKNHKSKNIVESKLKEIIKQELNTIVKESNVRITTMHADKFISEVLKLGTRGNLFDVFMKKEGIPSNDLSDFVELVVNQIKTKWL